jgi:hypothetical protein
MCGEALFGLFDLGALAGAVSAGGSPLLSAAAGGTLETCGAFLKNAAEES